MDRIPGAVLLVPLWILVVLILVLRARRPSHALAPPPDLPRLASALGLTVVDNRLVGEVQGVAVEVDLHPAELDIPQPTIRVELSPELDLGLALTERRGAPRGAEHLATGHTKLDWRYLIRVDADAVDRARALFEHEGVIQALTTTPLDASLEVRDDCVLLGARLERIGDQLHPAVAIRLAMDGARTAVPVATALAHHERSWRAFAASHALRFHSLPLGVAGRFDGRSVTAFARRIGEGTYELECSIAFDAPLDIGLRITPAAENDARNAKRSRLKVRDPQFDANFTVYAHDVAGARAVLDARLIRRLCALHDAVGRVELDDCGMTALLPSPPVEADALLSTLIELGLIAELIEEHTRVVVSRSAYR